MIDRRSLLRTGGVLAATGALVSVPTAVAAEPAGELPTRNPLVEQRADPFITPPTDGMYYLTGSVPEY
ncbi:MAG TPA: alpha-arabinofuranosidase, partial [Lentzea sp.]